jgi:hypothetical protein
MLAGILAAATVVALLAGACGEDDPEDVKRATGTEPTQEVGEPGNVSNSSVAPDTFLTFEDARYRLESFEQADLPASDSDFEESGTATEADIDQADLTVYRKAGDSDAVYTYAPARGDGDEATPALWYRWVPEP